MAVVQVFRKNRTVSLEVELKRFEPLISVVHSLHDSLQEVSRACTNPKVKIFFTTVFSSFDIRLGYCMVTIHRARPAELELAKRNTWFWSEPDYENTFLGV